MSREKRDYAIFLRDLRRATRLPAVTVALIAINVGLFALEVLSGRLALFSPSAAQLLSLGANDGALSLDAEPWRLATSMFLHVGIVHLFFNMLVLWQGGPLIERIFGSVPFSTMYLAAGIGGSLASALSQSRVSAGASGAIFGLFGGLGGYLLRYRRELPREIVRTFGSMVSQFVVYNIGIGLLIPFIDMSAHLGGLATGFVAGLLLATPVTPEGVSARNGRALLAGVALAALLAGTLFVARSF